MKCDLPSGGISLGAKSRYKVMQVHDTSILHDAYYTMYIYVYIYLENSDSSLKFSTRPFPDQQFKKLLLQTDKKEC